ncbi:carboxymuconolactone decarboxylase family protein [Haloarcula sp. JP-L23]|uniref:carboxymuconolactone decarboxylase family protein n=1 Tax=Haloarcula sp. JP-L23 TaxID=2716717 RepID=UPI00140ECC16|nr:carboxymuconolactone decarboxylase family protein [Haloarcula sp. JP-L23]
MATEQQPADVKEEITETFGMVPPPLDTIPEDDMVGEWHFFHKYTVGESEIPPKYRELMGLAVAANIKCPYCIHFHRKAAAMHGATDEELAEATSLASLTSRYSAMLHAQETDLDEFKVKMAQVADHLEEQAADD